MNQENEQTILSSTGRTGVSRRPDGRLYVNPTDFANNPELVAQTFQRLLGVQERHPQKVGRSVYRTIASDEVFSHISQNGQAPYIEVALPMAEFTGDTSWLVYLAHNNIDRTRIVSQNQMISEASERLERSISPLERVVRLREEGYTFSSQIHENEVAQVEALWGETFGWTVQEIRNLSHRLEMNQNRLPEQRDVWFSAVKEGDQIVSLAMAERLSMPARNMHMDIVESTEWRTRPGQMGRGTLAGALALLNAQVLRDRPRTPLIYAECNFQSRSDRAGVKAGFRIPDRDMQGRPAPQILVQNVRVGDGFDFGEGRLRDFTFMYLPVSEIGLNYRPENIRSFTNLIDR